MCTQDRRETVLLQHFLEEDEHLALFDWLRGHECNWERETFTLFGRTIDAPRQVCWFGDTNVNYRYTGLDHVASGWPAKLRDCLTAVNRTAGDAFNFVLINRYESGSEYMGWHKDDERYAAPWLASVSLGAQRRFVIEEKGQRIPRDLTPGSLLMFDGTQRHQLPRTARDVGPRINLSFRRIQQHV